MADFDIDMFLAEISTEAPCGEDISYDVAFMELERLAEGTAETQVGDHIQEGEEPDWKKVYKLSLDLLERSRDVRLILYLTASALRLKGLSGFCDGLALLRGTVERYWEDFFPQLDPDDDNDPLERMNIIGSLSPPATVMSDQDPLKFISCLKEVPLCEPADARLPSPSLRQILLASGELAPTESESSDILSKQIIDAAFEQSDIESLKTTDQLLCDCLDHIQVLDQTLMDHVGSNAAPNFSRLERVLKQMQSKTGAYLERRGVGTDETLLERTKKKFKGMLDGDPSSSDDAAKDNDNMAPSGGGHAGQALSGAIASNQDVQRALDMILTYYERNEPSSPVPILIKRAKRLVGKNFVDIIRDLSPDAMSQVQMFSGEENPPEE